jgi:hypothetical protein
VELLQDYLSYVGHSFHILAVAPDAAAARVYASPGQTQRLAYGKSSYVSVLVARGRGRSRDQFVHANFGPATLTRAGSAR